MKNKSMNRILINSPIRNRMIMKNITKILKIQRINPKVKRKKNRMIINSLTIILFQIIRYQRNKSLILIMNSNNRNYSLNRMMK